MNIASIMSKIIPGTFAPDMSDSEAPSIGSIPGLTNKPAGVASSSDAAGVNGIPSVSGATTFKDTVKQMLGDVNDAINTSDKNTRDLATGKTNDINKVVTSVEEANLALQYTMAIRTKLLEAYTEIEHMAV